MPINIRPLRPLPDKSIIKFWHQVDVSKHQGPRGQCWCWTGNAEEDGRGRVSLLGSEFLVARVAYYLYTGKDPGDLYVCHSCDWPPCVRREHLFLGTAQDNIMDAISKGRVKPPRVRGSDHYRSLLKESDVLEIRRLGEVCQLDQKEIAERFGVSKSCVGHILVRDTWRHI